MDIEDRPRFCPSVSLASCLCVVRVWKCSCMRHTRSPFCVHVSASYHSTQREDHSTQRKDHSTQSCSQLSTNIVSFCHLIATHTICTGCDTRGVLFGQPSRIANTRILTLSRFLALLLSCSRNLELTGYHTPSARVPSALMAWCKHREATSAIRSW